MRGITRAMVLGLALGTAAAPASFGQHATQKRLVLKSGDYQVADSWEIKGDRVRYHSTERNEWEEMPSALVDWDATNKYNSSPLANRSDDLKKADEAYEAEVRAEEAKNPAVAPGIHLPDQGGVWLLDTYQDKPQLVEVTQSGGELNKQTGKNLMRAIINPIPTGNKMSIELPGRHARIEAHIPQPSIYANIDDPNDKTTPALSPDQRWKIVRVAVAKDRRVLSKVNVNLLGRASESQDVVPATVQKAGTEGWVKITPQQPLGPGQYALIEMISPKEINQFVWDFGINPAGPENPATRADKKKNPMENPNSRMGPENAEQQPTDKDTDKKNDNNKDKKPKILGA